MLPKTLKGRLAAAVMALVATACFLVTAIALEVAYREMKDSTGRQQYTLLTGAAAHLATELESKRAILRTLAEEIALQQDVRGAQAQEVLAYHAGLRQAFTDLVAIDPAGRIAGLQQPGYFLRSPLTDKRCLEETTHAGAALMLQPRTGRMEDKSSLLLTQPVLGAGGRILYVLCGVSSLEDSSVFSQAARLRPGASGYLFALTRGGAIRYHPDQVRRALPHGAAAALPAMAHAAMAGWDGWTFGDDGQGVHALLTYKQVGGTGWILASSFPANEALAGIARARRHAWIWTAALAVCAGVIGWSTMLVLLRPLRSLRRQVNAIERDEVDIDVLDIDRDDEIGALGRAFHSLSVKREIAEQRLKELSLTDTLTGLGNRRQFDHEVALLIEQATRYRVGLSIAFLDVDCFKSINDTHGHAAGDAVLREFGRRLRCVTRPTDRNYRFAGDEFVIVSERLDSGENARRFAAKILRSIRRPFDIGGGRSLKVTTSIGISVARFPVPPVGDLLQHADAALYRTKRAGRDGYTIKELGLSTEAAVSRPGLRAVEQ